MNQAYSGNDISLLAQRTNSQSTKYLGGEHACDNRHNVEDLNLIAYISNVEFEN